MVHAGASSLKHTGVRLHNESLILATLQQDVAGVYVRCAVPHATKNAFTIYLNKKVSSGTRVALFIVN